MAKIATSLNVDLFIVGTELSATQFQDAQWLNTISMVKQVYKGQITYGSNHGDSNLNWWSALDFIGVDAYFPLTTEDYPSVDTLVNGWQPIIAMLANMSQFWQRSIIFTEIGYQSTDNAAIEPWAASGNLSLQTQANCYQALYTAVWPEPWFAGVSWWAWTNVPTNGGPNDTGFTPHGKPAAAIVTTQGGTTR